MSDHVLLQEENGLVTLTLNRPDALNTIDLAMGAALRKVFAELAQRKDLRAVLITAKGKYFSAGGNVPEFGGLVQQELKPRQDYSISSLKTYTPPYRPSPPCMCRLSLPCKAALPA